MRALVERLLMLGPAMEPDFLEAAPVDLRACSPTCWTPAGCSADRDWGLSPRPDARPGVDEAKLRGALLNLVDNACGRRATATASR